MREFKMEELYYIYLYQNISKYNKCTVEQMEDLYTTFVSGVFAAYKGKAFRIDKLSPMESPKDKEEAEERYDSIIQQIVDLARRFVYTFEDFKKDHPDGKFEIDKEVFKKSKQQYFEEIYKIRKEEYETQRKN